MSDLFFLIESTPDSKLMAIANLVMAVLLLLAWRKNEKLQNKVSLLEDILKRQRKQS